MIIRNYYYTTPITRLLCAPARLVAPKSCRSRFSIGNTTFLPSTGSIIKPALFFFLSTFHSRAVQRKKKWKKNQARRLQCLINTGSRRVCATQRSRLDARATGAIRHPGHQRVLLLQLCSSISPLLTNKKPKLDKRERDTRRDSQAVLLTQNPLPVFSLIPDSLFKLLFFFVQHVHYTNQETE